MLTPLARVVQGREACPGSAPRPTADLAATGLRSRPRSDRAGGGGRRAARHRTWCTEPTRTNPSVWVGGGLRAPPPPVWSPVAGWATSAAQGTTQSGWRGQASPSPVGVGPWAGQPAPVR